MGPRSTSRSPSPFCSLKLYVRLVGATQRCVSWAHRTTLAEFCCLALGDLRNGGVLSSHVYDAALAVQTFGLLHLGFETAFVVAVVLMLLLPTMAAMKGCVRSRIRRTPNAAGPILSLLAMKASSRVLITVLVIPLSRVVAMAASCWSQACSGLLCLNKDKVLRVWWWWW